MKLQNVALVFVSIFTIACSQKEVQTPKPRVYPRIDRVDSLVQYSINEFTFSYPIEALFKKEPSENISQLWFNMEYSSFDAKLYCSLLNIKSSDIEKALTDNKRFLSNNRLPNTKVEEFEYKRSEGGESGMLYYFDGNTISPYQFYLTDGETYFLRGSLYYNKEVRTDSVAGVTLSLKHDIVKLMESFEKTR